MFVTSSLLTMISCHLMISQLDATAAYTLVTDIIKIENLPTFSGQKTDKLIGFSVVGLAKNTLWVMNLSNF